MYIFTLLKHYRIHMDIGNSKKYLGINVSYALPGCIIDTIKKGPIMCC